MDKTVLFQKQIRDNAQDLHSYMSDLSNWEKDMKRKEAELTGVPIEQEYPPVRSKIKKSKPVNPSPKTVKNISGFDYSCWDKFDADKACEMVDEEDIGPTSLDGEMSEEQKLEKFKEEALLEKEKGNQFVKLQKWDDAIGCYTRAINLHKYDAIYFANRGLCYLKKENLHAAEADCTKALELDPKYVKALQRRSCAREALGSLRRAASDLREILLLEPGNVVVKKQLVALTQRMGTKGPNSKSSPATTPSEEFPVNGFNDSKTHMQDILKPTSDRVTPINKAPFLRSKDKDCEMVYSKDIEPTPLDGKMSNEQIELLKERSLLEKEKGNQLLKLQKWDDAIMCYTRAINIYNYDAIYYANRGLCYLKKENLHAAEADCTKALELDPKYVKALQRRSCAREALGSLRRAASDLQEILLLEPKNAAVKKQLVALTQKMGTKGPNSKSSPATTPSSEEYPVNGFLESKTKLQDINPVSDRVTPIKKAPHLRSKAPLVRVPIQEIPFGASIPESPMEELEETTTKYQMNASPEKLLPVESPVTDVIKSIRGENKCFEKMVNGVQSIESVDLNSLQLDDLPDCLQVPKSSIQFLTQWRLLRGRDKERSKYLKAIPPVQLPVIFQNFLESDVLSDILDTLCNGADFKQADSSPLPYLKNLTNVKRFSALAMFLSEKDKHTILDILQRCQDAKKCSEEEYIEIKTKFEL